MFFKKETPKKPEVVQKPTKISARFKFHMVDGATVDKTVQSFFYSYMSMKDSLVAVAMNEASRGLKISDNIWAMPGQVVKVEIISEPSIIDQVFAEQV
jgi:hypothetical protein